MIVDRNPEQTGTAGTLTGCRNTPLRGTATHDDATLPQIKPAN
jgi:hypothetical protein